MKRILFAAFAGCFLLMTQSGYAQSVCFEAGTILVQTPGGNNCALVATQATAGATAGVVADLSFGSIGNFQNLTYTGQLYGDLGQPVNDGTAALTQGCQVGGALHVNTKYSPGVHTVYATFVRCGQYGPAYYSGQVKIVVPPPNPATNPPPPCTPYLIDPVRSGLLRGPAITTDISLLGNLQNYTVVTGVSADGITEALVVIPTQNAGDSVQLNLINDANSPSISSAEDGGLTTPGSNVSSLANYVPLISVATVDGPMAFAIYQGPVNFARGTETFPQDNTAVARQVTLQTICLTSGGSPSGPQNTAVAVMRPPVVLVHGLWSSPQKSWSSFNPTASSPGSPESQLWTNLTQNSASVIKADYSACVPVNSTTPSFPLLWCNSVLNTSQVRGSALGYEFNAPIVLKQIFNGISTYASSFAVAASQADVIAHSMGGVIIRAAALPNEPWTFFTNGNYNQGPIEKLITIGTPHLGSQLATQLLPTSTGQDPNYCVRTQLGILAEDFSIQVANIGGNSVNGGVNDLVGSGQSQSGGLSLILSSLQTYESTQPFPMAYIGGFTVQSNLANLGDIGASSIIKSCAAPGINDPIASQLTPTGWDSLFNGYANDGIVALTSQVNASPVPTTALTFSGVVHTGAIVGPASLGFVGPSELDPGPIAAEVMDLLNEPKSGGDFHH